jgi:hypothetical protein
LASLLGSVAACGESDNPIMAPNGGASGSAGASGSSGAAGTDVSGGGLASGGAAGAAGSAGTTIGGSATAGVAGMNSGGLGGDTFGGAGGSSGAGGMSGEMQPQPRIPPVPANCPKIAPGNITVLGQQVSIWLGPPGKKGPLLFYWHGTGGVAEQALQGVAPALDDIQANGGIVASFTTSTNQGFESGPHVWHLGDFDMTDVIFACGVDQGLVDPRRVYTSGCSAGGLQSSVMIYERSSYLAAAMPNSGGLLKDWTLEDPNSVPAVMSTHGGPQDFVGVSFSQTTARLDQDILRLGGFVVDCDHGGGHCDSPPGVKAAQWRFLKAHPFGETPEPYASGLPQDFPSICKIVK